MSKYYLIAVGTRHCGQIKYHTLVVPEGKSLDDPEYMILIDEWVCDNAMKWYDDIDDGDYERYLADCYWESEEILYAEYLRMVDDY